MLPRLRDVADAQAGTFTRKQALACGYSADEVRARIRAGVWLRLRHGVYGVPVAGDPVEHHRRACWAAILAAGPSAAISGPSACMLHGFAAVTVPTVVHVTGRSPRSAPGLCVTRSAYSPAHVSSVDGLAVVVPPLAIVGTAQVLPFDEAVVVADSALRSGAVGPDEFKGDLNSVTQRPAVARVLRFADGRSESVGESLARVALDAAGIPTPELQRELVAAARTYRVDFYWPEHRTIGEFDGRVKYGADPAVLFDEKRREDELRALGLSFVRFGTAETRDLARLRAVVHAGFRQGDRLGG